MLIARKYIFSGKIQDVEYVSVNNEIDDKENIDTRFSLFELLLCIKVTVTLLNSANSFIYLSKCFCVVLKNIWLYKVCG